MEVQDYVCNGLGLLYIMDFTIIHYVLRCFYSNGAYDDYSYA